MSLLIHRPPNNPAPTANAPVARWFQFVHPWLRVTEQRLPLSHAMNSFTLFLALIAAPWAVVAAPLLPWGSNSIPDSVGWVFDFEGKRYDSELTRDALLSSPSWSPEQPLPLSTGNAVAAARKQVAALVSDASKWSAKEIQLLSANPLAPTQHWYYAIHFVSTESPAPGTKRDYIIVCVDFKGRAGTIKLKSG